MSLRETTPLQHQLLKSGEDLRHEEESPPARYPPKNAKSVEQSLLVL